MSLSGVHIRVFSGEDLSSPRPGHIPLKRSLGWEESNDIERMGLLFQAGAVELQSDFVRESIEISKSRPVPRMVTDIYL